MPEKALGESKAISNITRLRNAKALPGEEENPDPRLAQNSGSAGSPASTKASITTQLRRRISLPGKKLDPMGTDNWLMHSTGTIIKDFYIPSVRNALVPTNRHSSTQRPGHQTQQINIQAKKKKNTVLSCKAAVNLNLRTLNKRDNGL